MSDISQNVVMLLVVLLVGTLVFEFMVVLHQGILVGKAVGESGTISFSIIVVGLPAPFDLEAVVVDPGNAVRINWSNITQAESFTVYFSSNLISMLELNTSAIPFDVINVTGLTDTNFTDVTVQEDEARFYRVSSVRGTNENLSTEIVCAVTYRLFGEGSPSNAHRLENWLAFPCGDSFAERLLQDIIEGSGVNVTKLDRADQDSFQFITHVKGLDDGKNFSLELSRGYAVFVNHSVNHTVAGDFLLGPQNYSLFGEGSPSNAHRLENWFGFRFNTSFFTERFLQDIPNGSGVKTTRLERTGKNAFQFITHVKGLDDGKNFSLEPDQNYAMFVNHSENITR